MENFDYAGFEKAYGIIVSPETDPPSQDEAMEEARGEAYHEAREKPYRAIPKLEKLIKKYPDQTSFFNYLFLAYALSGQKDKARQILERTMRLFPDYLFGVANYVPLYPETRWVISQGHKLGKNLSITDWPIRANGTYHTTELLAFERAAIVYLVHQEKYQEAKDRINRLLKFGAEEEDIRPCINLYQLKMTERAVKRQQEQQKMVRRAEHAITTSVSSADTNYTLTHPEVGNFLEIYLDEMTEEDLAALLALPRESLVADLRKILRAGVAHYQQEYREEAFQEEEYWHLPVTHALYLLGGLEATEALPEVLDFLRIDEGAMDYFFGNFASTYYYPTLFSLTKRQPAVLVDYLLESKNYTFNRSVAQEVLTQIALHFPNRRALVLEGIRRIWQRMLDQPDDRFFIDTYLTSSLFGNANKLRATELLPLAWKLSEHDLIDPSVAGTVEDVEPEFHRPLDAGDRDPQPATPYEYYSEAYRERKAAYDFPIPIEEHITPLDMILLDRVSRAMAKGGVGKTVPSISSTIITDTDNDSGPARPVRKIGRNEPCSCGSGKKYKKCCLGK